MLNSGMARKPTPKPDDPEQSKRFIDMAREVGAERASPDFERVFRKEPNGPRARLLRPAPDRPPRLLADLRGKPVHKVAYLIDRPLRV
jgi:hypothetical protein